jgi:hypothetical protein
MLCSIPNFLNAYCEAIECYFTGVDYALCFCPNSLYAYFEAANLEREKREGSSGNLAKALQGGGGGCP